jgi:hypothetical protein
MQRTDWSASERFLDEYRAASPPLQALAEREIHFLQRRVRSHRNWLSNYDRVAGLRGHVVIEVEVGSGPRILAHFGDRRVTLMAFGDHGVVGRYVRGRTLEADLASRVALPPAFRLGHKDRFFPPTAITAAPSLTPWASELSRDWLYFLDEEQLAIADGIVDNAEEVLLSEDSYCIHVVVGGPGTGKTSILLHLLERLSDQITKGAETWRVGLDVSDELSDFIEASTGWKLAESRRLTRSAELDVLLVDDPRWLQDVASQAIAARGDFKADEEDEDLPHPKVVVVAFDPLQLQESVTDKEYARFLEAHAATEWPLRTSYRQKEKVGAVALNVAKVVAESSPFFVEQKQRKHTRERKALTTLANSLVFRNPSGFAKTYEDAQISEWVAHLTWIRSQRGLWEHWPPLLVVSDEDAPLPDPWRNVAHALLRCREVTLAEIEVIKGLEFQHVAVVLSEERYEAVESGFSGSGRPVYNQYRLLRIPFSRAKDSIGVFVLS